jgi:hypothetical protein
MRAISKIKAKRGVWAGKVGEEVLRLARLGLELRAEPGRLSRKGFPRSGHGGFLSLAGLGFISLGTLTLCLKHKNFQPEALDYPWKRLFPLVDEIGAGNLNRDLF